MRLPRARLTVRRLLIAVAVAALAFEGEMWRRRYEYCRRNAERCVSSEEAHLWMAESHRRVSALYREHAKDPRESARFNNEQSALFNRAAWEERARSSSAAQRGSAFRRSALYPWLPLPPPEADPTFSVPDDREGDLDEAESPGRSGQPPRKRFPGST